MSVMNTAGDDDDVCRFRTMLDGENVGEEEEICDVKEKGKEGNDSRIEEDEEEARRIAESVAMEVLVSPERSPVDLKFSDGTFDGFSGYRVLHGGMMKMDDVNIGIRNGGLLNQFGDERTGIDDGINLYRSGSDSVFSTSALNGPLMAFDPMAHPTNYFLADVKTQKVRSEELHNSVIWVGNLPGGVEKNDLITLFRSYGVVTDVKMLVSKHCGFVTFADESSAKSAMKAMDGYVMNGKTIHVNTARESAIQSSQKSASSLQRLCAASLSSVIDGVPQQSSRQRGPVVRASSRAVWVGNVGDDVTDAQFAMYVTQFGPVESVKLLREKRCGFVNYLSISVAQEAIRQMQGQKLGECVIKVNYAQPPTSHRRHPKRIREPAVDDTRVRDAQVVNVT